MFPSYHRLVQYNVFSVVLSIFDAQEWKLLPTLPTTYALAIHSCEFGSVYASPPALMRTEGTGAVTGVRVGASTGATTGALVGTGTGARTGAFVGVSMGVGTGAFVGAFVGTGTGGRVGAFVGKGAGAFVDGAGAIGPGPEAVAGTISNPLIMGLLRTFTNSTDANPSEIVFVIGMTNAVLGILPAATKTSRLLMARLPST